MADPVREKNSLEYLDGHKKLKAQYKDTAVHGNIKM